MYRYPRFEQGQIQNRIQSHQAPASVLFRSGIAGIPGLSLHQDALGTSTAGILMVLIMAPFFFLAMYEKDGLPFEQILLNYLNFLRTDQVRTYQTDNLYRQLEHLKEKTKKEVNIFELQKKKK